MRDPFESFSFFDPYPLADAGGKKLPHKNILMMVACLFNFSEVIQKEAGVHFNLIMKLQPLSIQV